MASHRIGRINEEIQREMSTLIRNVKDPRVTGMISITAVNTTPEQLDEVSAKLTAAGMASMTKSILFTNILVVTPGNAFCS